MAHILDNVIWEALTSRQIEFAEACGIARRFVREVTSLTALAEESEAAYASLGDLVGPDGTAALFLDAAYEGRIGWDHVAGAPLPEMVCEDGALPHDNANSDPELVLLRLPDWPEKLAQATLSNTG